MQLFYSENISKDEIVLEGQEALHCSKVLRKKVGDIVNVLDGKGKMYEGTLYESNKKHVRVTINKIVREEVNQSILPRIGIGIIKSSTRFEWFIEKSVEIGVSEIYPLICNRSERTKINLERTEKIVLGAMKQSIRLYKPIIHPPIKLKDYLSLSDVMLRYIAHYSDDNPSLSKLSVSNVDQDILIGPEGDFTDEELQSAVQNDFIMVNLSTSRLRTETAGIVALTLLNNN